MAASPQRLCEFIDASPSPFHVCVTVAQRLSDGGLHRTLRSGAPWPSAAGRERLLHRPRAGSLGRWRLGDDAGAPFRIVGGHTDSPNLRVKQHPDRFVSRLAGGGARALRRRVAELVARPRPRDQRATVRPSRQRQVETRARPSRRPDPAGAATGDPPGRRPQGASRWTRNATSTPSGASAPGRGPSSTTWPSVPTSTRTRCWPPT